MTISAPSVSAKLRAAGFGIVATRNREGIRVSRGIGGRVSVCVDLDRPGEAKRTAALLEEWLATNARSLGWQWTKAEGAIGIYTISPIQGRDDRLQGRDDRRAKAVADAQPMDLVSRAVADMAAGKVVSFTTEPVYVAQKPLQPRPEPGTPSEQARTLSLQVRTATLALENSVRARKYPAPADITAARTALEALITLAGGDQ